MAHKTKISAEERAGIVQRYLAGEISRGEASREADVVPSVISDWAGLYRNQGILGLCETTENSVYSPELKKRAVEEYLSGGCSQQAICERYKIRSRTQLRAWIKVYNDGSDFKKTSGGCRMKTPRATTHEERVEIAKDCLKNDMDYGAAAMKYNVSYQQVYTWVRKFTDLGEAGLEDRRGKRTAQQEPRTEAEELRIRIAQLEHELYVTKMERDLLKKVEELERGEAYRK